MQDKRNIDEDTGAGTGAKRKNQFQGQFQNQSVSEQLRELLDIPTICLMYKSLLRYVSNDRQMMGQARDEDEKALRGCHQLLEAVSGQDPVKWFGHEEGQIVNMILNVTDQEMANNYTQISDVTRDRSALAKYQRGEGRAQPMNSTGASMHGPGMDTFIGSFGTMTDEGEDSESHGEADDEEEEESIEQKTVATMESTLIQSVMD